MSVGRKKLLENDYVFSIISKIISVVVSIFHAAFLARFLGPELKGDSASITSIVTIGSVIITVGIHQAFPYYRKDDHSRDFLNKFCTHVIVIYGVLFLIAFLIFAFCDLGIVVGGSVLLIPLFGYETIINYVFLVEAPKKRNSINIIASLIETIALFVFWLLLKPNNMLMLSALSIAVVIRALVSTVLLRFCIKIKQLSIKYLLGLFRFGLLPMFALLLTMLNSRVDILMLNIYTNVSKAQIGIYSVGVGLAEKALLIPDAIREILLGKLVSGKGSEEVCAASRIGSTISFVISIGILFLGRFVIDLLYGYEYSSAYIITLISAFGTIFLVYIKMISQYNIVHKKQMTNAILLLVSVAVNVLFNIILIPKMGIEGAAIATLAGHFVCGACFVVSFTMRTTAKVSDIVFIKKRDFKSLKNLLDARKGK